MTMMTETHMRQYIPVCDNAETLAGPGTGARRCSDALGPRKNLHRRVSHCVYLTGVHVICVYLINVHLIGVCFIGVHFMGVHHRMQPFLLSRIRICCFRWLWPDVAFLTLTLSGTWVLSPVGGVCGVAQKKNNNKPVRRARMSAFGLKTSMPPLPMLWASMSVIDESLIGCKAEGILELPRRVKKWGDDVDIRHD
jgi:hypothetical protein